MLLDNNRNICLMIVFFIINQISGLAISYNQPKLCPNALWDPNAITFANNNTVGVNPQDIFVNINNTVYITASSLNQIQVFFEGDIAPTRTISGGLINPVSLFVTVNNNIYVDNGNNDRVDMWTLNATNSVPAMYVDTPCISLFVDINNILYCSLRERHQVIKKSLYDTSNTSKIAVGTGSSGTASNMLRYPRGIFVNINLDLYVADCDNDRIQLFHPGQLNGITIAGTGAQGTIILNSPTGIVLDADGYLFIVDAGNHRIIGSDPNGFRCLVGCSGTSGSSSNQLMYPYSLSFDSYGNIFVTDWANNRIQKFILASNSCDSTTTSSLPISTTKTLTTKGYIWSNSTSSANDYSHNYYFIFFLFYCNYIIMI